MLRATDLAHLVLRDVLRPGALAIDATVGNGHDTAMLAAAVGPTGRVFGFDVQAAALATARVRLAAFDTVVWLHDSHEHLAARLPVDAHGRIAAIVFNLGYLPGGDKSIATSAGTTIAALQQALDVIAVGGRIALVLYPGHPGGAEEATAVHAFTQTLPIIFAATHCRRINAGTMAPELVLIERLE